MARTRSYRRYSRRNVRRPRSYRTTRKYKRRTYRSRRKSGFSLRTKKRILNVTSRKKKDHMVALWKPDVLTPPIPVPGGVDLGLGSGTLRVFGWVATARDNTTTVDGGNFGTVYDESTRTSDDCYIRGLKETVQFATDNALPFQWRRIAFHFTGQEMIRDQGSANVGSMWAETNSQGWTRAMTQLLPASGPASFAWSQMQNIIFRGVASVDWLGYTLAPLDHSRIKVVYDQVRTVRSNNEEGTLRNFNFWIPVNKRLVYNDDEVGGGMSASVLSANNFQSCGDLYVIDIFELSPNTTEEQHYIFQPQACLYWHEK